MNNLINDFAFEFVVQKIWTSEDFSLFVQDEKDKSSEVAFSDGWDEGRESGYAAGYSDNY